MRDMLLSIFLAGGAFVLAMTALLHDVDARRLKIALRVAERFADPVGRLVLVLSVALLALSIGKAIGDGLTRERAVAEAERERGRLRTAFGDPELVVIAEFPAAGLRSAAKAHPELAAKLNELFALVRETPIPPDACAGLQVAHGAGAVPVVGALLAFEGGLAPVDFLTTLGFYRAGKDTSGFAKSGFELFDMFLTVNFAAPAVELAYVRPRDTFRLVVAGEGSGYSADPATMISADDLPGAVAVLQPANTNSAFARGYVKALVMRDRFNKQSFGVDFSDLRPAGADSGWPPGTFLGTVSEPINPCVPMLAGAAG
jgi:hypothetical protein